MAAIAFTRVLGPVAIGDRYLTVTTVTPSTAYPTNGEPVTKANLGFASTADPEFHAVCSPSPVGGYLPTYDHTNSKVKIYDQKDPAAAGGADIAYPEVGNGTDLSTFTFRVTAWGKYRA